LHLFFSRYPFVAYWHEFRILCILARATRPALSEERGGVEGDVSGDDIFDGQAFMVPASSDI
jgi:hypothetical protein